MALPMPNVASYLYPSSKVIEQQNGNVYPGADHLCVLIHGLWGTPIHLTNIAKVLRKKYPEDRLSILIAKRNSGSFTYDGVELGGERVCQEIEEEIKRLEEAGQTIRKLSVVGYSLGGLVARYAVGLLYSRGLFDKVQPVHFTTFATPHLGVRTPLRGYHNHLWNVLGARTLSMSGRQLFIIDDFRETGRPLLAILADPSSIFIKGLAQFKRRTLYANIINDRSAVFYTCGITKKDPFEDLENLKINYLQGYEPVIVNPDDPILQPEDAPPHSVDSQLSKNSRTIQQLPLKILFMCLIPLGAVMFLLNAAIQTIRSYQRIRLHEAGKAGIEIDSYRGPFLIGVREAVEGVYENLNSAQSHEYLVSSSEEEGEGEDSFHENGKPVSVPTSPSKTKSLSSEHIAAGDILERESNGQHVDKVDIDVKTPTLALTPGQFSMIQALDEVGWRKYPVYIHDDRHSHAAMIVRMNKPTFHEGWVVLRHWLDEEFIMD